MKILNIFKKKEKTDVKSSTIQKLEKNQLEKVIGGAGDPIPGVDVALEQNPGSGLRKK